MRCLCIGLGMVAKAGCGSGHLKDGWLSGNGLRASGGLCDGSKIWGGVLREF